MKRGEREYSYKGTEIENYLQQQEAISPRLDNNVSY